MKKYFKVFILLTILFMGRNVYATSELLDNTNMYNRAYKNIHLAISDVKDANLSDAEAINNMINFTQNGTYYDKPHCYQEYYQLLGLGDGVCSSYNEAARELSQMSGANCFNIISRSADHKITACYYNKDWHYYDATGGSQPDNNAYNARAEISFNAGFVSTYNPNSPYDMGGWFFGQNQSTNLTSTGEFSLMFPMPVGGTVTEKHLHSFYDSTYLYYFERSPLEDYTVLYRKNRTTGTKAELARVPYDSNLGGTSGLVKDYNYFYFLNYADGNKPYRMNLDGSNKTKLSDTVGINIWREFDSIYIYDTNKTNVKISDMSSYPKTATYTINDGTSAYKIIYVYNNNGATIIDVDGLLNDTPTGVIQVPSTLGGKPVIGIAPSAYRSFDNSVVTEKLVLPSTLLYIGGDAFRYSNIKEVVLNSGLKAIGNLAFDSSKISTKVTIPSTVTFIGRSAFSNNKIPSVEIPNGIKVLGDSIFEDNKITSVELPSSLEVYTGSFGGPFGNNDIEELSFGSNIKEITIGSYHESLKRIFINGSNLDYVNISGLDDVEVYAHSNTTTATTLTNAGIDWIDIDNITYTIEGEDNITIDKSRGTVDLDYTIKPSYVNYTTTWSSSNPDVATVKNGKVTLWMAGEATITLRLSTGVQKEYHLTVTDNPITDIRLGIPTSKPFRIGTRFKVNITVTPSDADITGLTYTSSDPSVLRINEYDGKYVDFELLKGGEATLTIDTPSGMSEESTFRVYYRPKSIAISGPSDPIYIGDTFEITRTIVADGEWEDFYYYGVSDPDVLEVLDDGRIYAKGVGYSQVYIYEPDKPNNPKASASITVKAIPVSSVTLNKDSVSFEVGDTDKLTATVLPENAGDKTINWSSSNTNVVTVDSQGNLKGIGVGVATIYARSNADRNISATCRVVVNAKTIPVTGISLNKTSITLVEKKNETLTATITPSDATNKTITWTSSDPTIATVSSTGKVTAKKKGTATITATTNNGKKATCTVTVTEIPVTSITLSKTSVDLIVGKSTSISATVLPVDAANKEVTWTSSNSSIASIEDKIITAHKAGTATITATTSNGLKATCTVTVTSNEVAVTGVTLSESFFILNEGESKTVVATITPSNATNKHLTWTSSEPTIASVDQNGKVTALKVGKSTITATADNGQKKTCVVEVKAPLKSISLNKTSITLKKGEKANLNVIYNPSYTTDDKKVTWTSDERYIADVSSTGEVETYLVGETKIRAKVGKYEAVCTVKVVDEDGLPFVDVPKTAWYYNTVKEAYNRGIIAGYSSTIFGPGDKVTRGQLVTFLWRIEGQPEVTSSTPLKDIKEGQYYTKSVKWASKNKVVNGYKSGNFGPNDPITRKDLAVILNNYAKYKGKVSSADQDLSIFADYKLVKGGYAEPALKWAVKYKVMSGQTIKGKKYISPTNNATRAEAATMIVNFIKTFNIGN